MTISWTRLSLSVLGLRSRSQWQFLDKHCHRSSSSAFIHRPILILYHTNVKYDNILDKFERSRAKVNVTVAVFRKTLSSLWCPHLLSNFNIISHKYWV